MNNSYTNTTPYESVYSKAVTGGKALRLHNTIMGACCIRRHSQIASAGDELEFAEVTVLKGEEWRGRRDVAELYLNLYVNDFCVSIDVA